MSTDKCPKCQSPVVPPYLWQYGCGRNLDGTASELCEARAQLAELRKELEKSKADSESWHQQAQQRLDDANEFGRKWEEAEKMLVETRNELERWKNNAGTAVTVEIERIQAQRDAAESRVRELEGLRVLSRDIGTITLLLDQDLSTVPPLTLGEAMQRKEGV